MLVHVGLVGLSGDLAGMYRDVGIELPALTRLTISTTWQLGVPVIGLAAIGALVVRRPRSLAPYVVIALALAAATACTYWYPSAPIRARVGDIPPD